MEASVYETLTERGIIGPRRRRLKRMILAIHAGIADFEVEARARRASKPAGPKGK